MSKKSNLERNKNEVEEEITETPQEQVTEVVETVKPKKTRAPKSQKQLEAFEKARLKRLSNLKDKKEKQAKELHNEALDRLEAKIIKEQETQVNEPIKAVKVKRPAKVSRKKKTVVYFSESESEVESDDEIIIKRRPKSVPTPRPKPVQTHNLEYDDTELLFC